MVYSSAQHPAPHCPKITSDFQEYRGGSPLEGKFPDNFRKLGILSSVCWEISPTEDFLLILSEICFVFGTVHTHSGIYTVDWDSHQ